MGHEIELSVCLVNHNDAGHVAACIDSVEADARDIPHEILVMDNASSDGSVALLQKKYPGVKLLPSDRNLGFGRANNRAAKECRGEFLLFVNTDVVVRPGSLSLLLNEMRGHPSTGAVGPALLNPGDVFQVSFGGRTGFFTEALKKGLLNKMQSRALRRNRDRREVGWVSGAFLLTRRKVFFDAGGFDENIFLYFEDIDLCARIRGLGTKVVFLPEAVSFHWGGAVTTAAGLRSRLEYRRGQLYYYRKHNSKLSQGLLRLYIRVNTVFLGWKGAFRAEPPEVRDGFRRLLKKPGT